MKKILALLILTFLCLSSISCGNTLEWPNTSLGNMLPKIDGAKGEVTYESLDALHISLENISEAQYTEYIESCKSRGFSVDAINENNSFTAFNENGYKIDLYFYSSGDLSIKIEVPINMSQFNWPNSEIAKLLPKPKSSYGKIQWEADYGFVIYVGNTTKSEYQKYVDSVYDRGFTVDYKKGDTFFYADNKNGYHVSLIYEGFNTMFVRIDEPDDSDSNNSNNNSSGGNNSEENDSSSGELVDGMRPKFKEAMDSYEAFFDDYCSFMKKYNSSSNQASMMSDYLNFMTRFTETMNKLNELDNSEMNDTELRYYTQVMNRINQKLLEIS